MLRGLGFESYVCEIVCYFNCMILNDMLVVVYDIIFLDE